MIVRKIAYIAIAYRGTAKDNHVLHNKKFNILIHHHDIKICYGY